LSELTLFLIRFAYLAVLWIFVLSAVSVVRSDMFGARLPQAQAVPTSKRRAKNKSAKPTRRRGAPSHVIVVEGPNTGTRAEMTSDPVLIGRGTDAAIRLDDDYVSTRHARIALSEGTWYAEDLGSTNGTYLGPTRLTEPVAVSAGMQVRVGKTVLELRK
jgi:pSer/pThr/pTyr-binding forkhead associated (FHA) protein